MKSDSPCLSEVLEPTLWDLCVDPPLSAQENMDRDVFLLEGQKDPEAIPVLRFFFWETSCVTYGRLQNPEWVEQQLDSLGVREFVKRPTGGGLVHHEDDLSFSLTWRRNHPAFPKCLKNIYAQIHETIQLTFNKFNIKTTLFNKCPSIGQEDVCFKKPVEKDLLLGGQKILGGALKVTQWGRLYQGSLSLKSITIPPDRLLPSLIKGFEENFFRRAYSSRKEELLVQTRI